jgi:hypothetical protein
VESGENASSWEYGRELGDFQRGNSKDIGDLWKRTGGASVKKSEWWTEEAVVAVREKAEQGG